MRKTQKAKSEKQAFTLPLKKAQNKKQEIFYVGNKIAQEEMVGFALILIIVSIIIIVFVALTLTKPQTEEVQSYEVESFLQAVLQHTSDCEDYGGMLSVQNLVFRCKTGGYCLDGRDTCEVLNETLTGIITGFWRGGSGYKLSISAENESILEIEEGNFTGTYRGANQLFSNVQISFKAYS